MTVSGASSGTKPQRLIDSTGAFVNAVPAIVRVVGPASYATGGFQVDCSSIFSSILAAMPARSYVTATGVIGSNAIGGGRAFLIDAGSGTDTYANAKFRCMPTKTFAAVTPTFTGSAIGGAHACGAVGCDSSHPNSTTVPAGTISQVGTQVFNEMTAATDLSAITFEFMVWGVPK